MGKDKKEKRSQQQESSEQTKESKNVNTFSDDGSFLAQFQKKMAEMKQPKTTSKDSTNTEKAPSNGDEQDKDSPSTQESSIPKLRTVEVNQTHQQGKRKITVGKMGGFAKKPTTAMKKAKQDTEEKSSAWQSYLQEVQKYQEASGCSDNDHFSRPLVK